MPTRRIIRPGRNCWDIKGADKTGIIIDARDYYRVFYHAAKRARRTILISGWQFDSDVRLLRGEDLKDAREDIRFLNFLNTLCEANPDLRVYILAWDFSIVFTFAREWMQKLVFSRAHPGISFHFDHNHAYAACQHQKFAVIDGAVAFVGGMDICASRWDDRSHLPRNPYRVDENGRNYGPYHDVHSYHTGPVVRKLTELFRKRWKDATGLEPRLGTPHEGDYLPDGPYGMPISAKRVALSRTQARSLVRLRRSVREIRFLYTDAIRAAKELIYIESQYFSSYAVYRALVKRMKSSRSTLQIIIILPKHELTVLERAYVGIAQTKLLRSLKRVARRRGHRLGIYYPAVLSEEGLESPVFIHSKLLLVDDRFLTVGSANVNNRSMGLDTELNVAWEDVDQDIDLTGSLRDIRVELLSEHTGIKNNEELGRTGGLIRYLESIADKPASRLRRHRMKKSYYLSGLLTAFKLDRILIDPETAVIDENILEMTSPDKKSLLKRGVEYLRKKVFKK